LCYHTWKITQLEDIMRETLGKFSDGIRKTIAALEKTDTGINYVKDFLDILNTGNADPQPPHILNRAETQAILDQMDSTSSFEGYVFRTYLIIADECAEYANFLIENELESDQEIISGSLPYIQNLYSQLAQFFKFLSKTKWDKYSCDLLITSFAFLSDLICGEKDLARVYSLDFLTDISELWEIIVEITDQINNTEKFNSFSNYITLISPGLNQSTQAAIEFLESDFSPRERRKMVRIFKKLVRRSSKQLASKFALEAYLIRKNM